MPELTPEISGSTIVLIGSFNPQIFHPEWFAHQDLLPEAEAASAEIKLIVPQVSQFETVRFIFQVTQERFSIMTKPSANDAPLSDLVMGTFSILEHTPVKGMGLNFHKHFAMESEEQWHRFGDRVAPKEAWNKVLPGRPGLVSMTIQSRFDSPEGAQFTIKAETSTQVTFGIYFDTNENYPAPKDNALKTLMNLLGERWGEAQSYATTVVNHILAWGIAE